MAFDLGGWLSGAGSYVQNVVNPQGSAQPMSDAGAGPIAVDAFGYEISPESPISAPVQPVIPENQSIVTDSRDETGEYKPISTDTSAPSTQTFVESYIEPTKEIDRVDYTKMSDIGDSKTQELIKQGYSPEQATAMQRDIAKEAGNTRAVLYYQNEYDKALQSKIALSSEYHHEAQESGLPQAPNPFEYTGDLAKMAIHKSQGVSNIPGTGLLPQFKGSLLEDANIVTKAARTGEMGDYGNLGKPFSSATGVLSLEEQQDIGRRAATSPLNKFGWEVKEDAMAKFIPELKKSSGFDLFYREAKTDEAKKALPGLLTSDYMASIVPGKGLKPTIQVGGTPTNEIIGGTIATVKKGSVEEKTGGFGGAGGFGGGGAESPGLFGRGSTFNKIFGSEMYDNQLSKTAIEKTTLGNAEPKTIIEEITPASTPAGVISKDKLAAFSESESYKSPVDKMMYSTGLGTEKNILGNKIGGRYGSGQTLGGYTLQTVGIYGPPSGPRGTYFNPRKARKSIPATKRKLTHKVADPKIFNLETINDNIMPKSLGKGMLKFKVGSLNKVVDSMGAQKDLKNIIKINKSDKIKTMKSISTTIKIPDFKFTTGKDVSGNINDIVKNITKPIKAIKNIKMKK